MEELVKFVQAAHLVGDAAVRMSEKGSIDPVELVTEIVATAIGHVTKRSVERSVWELVSQREISPDQGKSIVAILYGSPLDEYRR